MAQARFRPPAVLEGATEGPFAFICVIRGQFRPCADKETVTKGKPHKGNPPLGDRL